ncbi:TORC1 complex, subunit TCO89 [Niveomyces insectorum RCEF 264]|uniref:TORC1 complex, subunit TCO89 n=1 Tax=Niveomyces insectorum RCEF 264 TaxID=1081102 RepID=A0A167ZY09_9HYPO|nr:TORC1 complex, subunit TCO89 [Niveomyces insectorum RCEF 264]
MDQGGSVAAQSAQQQAQAEKQQNEKQRVGWAQSTSGSSTRSSGSGSGSEQDEQSEPTTPLQQGQPPPQQQQQQHQRQAQKSRKSNPQLQHATHTTANPVHSRPKAQKHIVGGGGGGVGSGTTTRLHARVPSSKALLKTVHHHPHHHQHQHQHHHHSQDSSHGLNALHHVSSTSSSKLHQQLQRRRPSPSPPLAAADFASRFPFAAAPPSPTQQQQQQQQQQQRPQPHRRSTSTSETKLHRSANSSSTSSPVRRNVSTSNLKRNRSHTDVAKRMSHGPSRTTAHVKRINSNPAVSSNKLRSVAPAGTSKKAPSQVRFEVGSPDAQDDEWVDAGSTSNVSGHQTTGIPHEQEEEEEEEVEEVSDKEEGDEGETAPSKQGDQGKEEAKLEQAGREPKRTEAEPPSQRAEGGDTQTSAAPPETTSNKAKEPQRPSSSASTAAPHLRTSSTGKLFFPRTPPRGAPPMMSTETALAMRPLRASSPDGSPSRQPPHQPQQSLSGGSSDREAMTSRFITTGSNESASAATAGNSFYTTSSSRPSTGRYAADERDAINLPNGMASSSANAASMSHPRRTRFISGDNNAQLTDDEDAGVTMAGGVRNPGMGSQPPRRTRQPHAPPAELSRTQQKLNLERASSSLDRSSRQRQGPAAGPLLGAGEFGMHDPRIGKLMEKTGMEYYVVRRYQNPVTRSLSRLTERLGGDKNWRIPAAHVNSSSHTSTGVATHPRPATAGLSQSVRERDIRRDALHSAAAATAAALHAAPGPPSRAQTMSAHGLPSGGVADDGSPSRQASHHLQRQQQHRRLSGTSLVDGYDEDSTAALLRNLWDKNLYLGTSQD